MDEFPKCQPPLIKTISLLLLEFYRFGTNHELKEFKRLIKNININTIWSIMIII